MRLKLFIFVKRLEITVWVNLIIIQTSVLDVRVAQSSWDCDLIPMVAFWLVSQSVLHSKPVDTTI